jgi:hypothetical protein
VASLDRPFSDFVRQHRPLSAYLAGMVNPLSDELRQLSSTTALDDFAATAAARIRAAHPGALALGGQRRADVRPGDWVEIAPGTRVPCTRHHVAVQVIGDPFLLCLWPSDGDDLTPADDVTWPESDLAATDNRAEVWMLNTVQLDQGENEWALYTYFDLTLDDEERVAQREIDFVLLVEERMSRATPVIARINAEIDEFFDAVETQHLPDAIARRRRELANRQAVSDSLAFPNSWTPPPPRLTEDIPASSTELPSSLVGEELKLVQTPRLAAKSFADLQQTIRVWADAVERYPNTFRGLGEDEVSDLLVATLNATMSAAHREVFSKNGKTDIFVHADILREGAGQAKVFIAENKKAGKYKVVREAIDPQLFGYLTTSDLAAVLLLIFEQKGFASARARHLAELRKVAGYLDTNRSAVDDWPILRFLRNGLTVSVCVASVHLPK